MGQRTSSSRSESIMVAMPDPCPPRFATPRTPSRPTKGHEAAAIAKAMGHELLPWQQQVLDVGLEMELVDGIWLPAYREIVVTVPRQCGKTLLTLVWELH